MHACMNMYIFMYCRYKSLRLADESASGFVRQPSCSGALVPASRKPSKTKTSQGVCFSAWVNEDPAWRIWRVASGREG